MEDVIHKFTYRDNDVEIITSTNGIRLFRDLCAIPGSDYVNLVFTKSNHYSFGDNQHECDVDDMELWFAHYMCREILDFAYPNSWSIPPELDFADQFDWVDHPNLVKDVIKYIYDNYMVYGITVREHSDFAMHCGEGISNSDTGVAFIHKHDWMMRFGLYRMDEWSDKIINDTVKSYCEYCNGWIYHFKIGDYYSQDYAGFCSISDYTGVIKDAKSYINNVIDEH